MSAKYCVNCICHVTRHDGFEAWSECNRLLSDKRDLVTGDLTDTLRKSCASERRSKVSLFGRVKCGPDAIFYRVGRS